MKSAAEYWKQRFGESPKSDSEKLAVAMMQEYSQISVLGAAIPSLQPFSGENENENKNKKGVNNFAFAQLTELCQMVDRGCKPVALITIRVTEYQKAIDIIYKDHSLHAIGKQLNESFFSVFIFKNYDLRFVLDLLPEKPKTPTEHALLGYLFGYDTDSICKYIFKNCELNEPNLM